MTHDITAYCKANIFSKIGKQTPLAVRFSTVGGESGSADTARDPRGFAVKFYTEEGNWDLVGNNTPIFFIRSVNNRANRRQGWIFLYQESELLGAGAAEEERSGGV